MSFESIIFEYFENMRRQLEARPMLLGAISASGGGLGTRPGGYLGYLPQTRVAYDESELATFATSGTPSLLDNLNHIRAEIASLSGGGSGPGSFTVKESDVLVASGITVLDFLSGFSVSESPTGEANITVTATGTGETNTGANVNVSGVGVFKQKSGTELQFKGINSGSTKISVTDDTGNNEIDIDVVESNISHVNISDIGTNSHAQIDTHIADSTVHFVESGISHLNIQDIGTNSHAQIDTHVADTTIHFDELGELADVNVATATSGQMLRYTGVIWENITPDAGHSPVTVADSGTVDLVLDNQEITAHVLASGVDHDALFNTHNLTTDIDHTTIQNIGTNSHAQIDTHISDTSIHFDELGELSDVDIVTAASGQYLRYDGVVWYPSSVVGSGGGASYLDELTDVTLFTLASGEVLSYNGIYWTNAEGVVAGHTHTSADITDLADITVSGTDTLELINDGVNLYGNVLPSGIFLEQLGNIDITVATSGEMIQYNGISWVNVSGVVADHTHTSDDITDLADITVSGTSTLELINDGVNLYGNVIASGVDHNQLLNTHNLTTDIDHTAISNIGTNSHAQIDTHISDTSIHFDELNELSDVNVSTATSGQLLKYTGAIWIADTVTGGTTDHGALTGLEDDDHPQYVLANGTRHITGSQHFEQNITSSGKIYVNRFTSGATAQTWADDLVIEGTTEAGISVLTNAGGIGYLAFGDPADGDRGLILFDHSAFGDAFKMQIGAQTLYEMDETWWHINPFNYDFDVRMDGQTLDNLFYLDGSTNRIGIGESTPSSLLHVVASDTGLTPLSYATVVLESNEVTGANLQLLSADGNTILFSRTTSAYSSKIDYAYTSPTFDRLQIEKSSNRIALGDFGFGDGIHINSAQSSSVDTNVWAGNEERALYVSADNYTIVGHVATVNLPTYSGKLNVVGDNGARAGIFINQAIPSYVNNNLYNVGGSLYWSGTSVLMSGMGGGVTDHGALTGLADDDHTQYILANGNRHFTGDQHFEQNITTSGQIFIYDKTLGRTGQVPPSENRGQLVIDNPASNGLAFLVEEESSSQISFGDNFNSEAGYIRYIHGAGGAEVFSINFEGRESFALGRNNVLWNWENYDVDFVVFGTTNDNLLFVDAGNDRVGIGTGTPGSELEIYQNNTVGPILTFTAAGDTSVQRSSAISFAHANGQSARIIAYRPAGNSDGSYLQFDTEPATGGGLTPRLRFDDNSTVFNESGLDYNHRIEGTTDANLINADAGLDAVAMGTNPTTATKLYVYASSALGFTYTGHFRQLNTGQNGNLITLGETTPTNGRRFMTFADANISIDGSISANGSGGVAFNQTSDRRLKRNIEDIKDAYELIKKLKPRKFERIENLGTIQHGFVAQELYEEFPEAVTPGDDSEGGELSEPWMVDNSKLIPILVATIQELQNKVEALEQKIKGE